MMTIGVDHGYAAMKTAHCAFPTGVVEYEHEPYTQKGALEYGGRSYVLGSTLSKRIYLLGIYVFHHFNI